MTLIESKPEERELAPVADAADDVSLQPPPPDPGFERVLATSDHKVVGRAYIFTALLFLGASLVLHLLLGLENREVGFDLLDPDAYVQVFTLANLSLFLLGLAPAFLGLAIYVVPLQMGANGIAFPRAAAASYWGFLVGTALLIAGYGMNGGVGGGDVEGTLIGYAGLGLVALALLVAAMAVVTTVVALRPPGMSMLRVPAFSWSMFVAGIVWLVTLPAFGANLLLLYVDSDHGSVAFSLPGLAWPQLRWVLLQPAVFAFAIPVLGIAADVVPAMTRSRIVNRVAVLGPIGAFGVLSFGPWAQTAFNPHLVGEATYIVMSVAIVLPVLALLGGLLDTVRRGGRPQANSSLPLALLSLVALLGAAVAGGWGTIPYLDLSGTTWPEGVAKLVAGASLLGLASGLAYWGPKIWGAMPVDALGKLNILVLLGGAALFGAGDLISGGAGQLPFWPGLGRVDRVSDVSQLGQLALTAGAALLVLGVVLLLLAHLPAAMKRSGAPADPWEGSTLEWSTSSPPPFINFLAAPALVTSAEPLLDTRAAAAEVPPDATAQEVE